MPFFNTFTAGSSRNVAKPAFTRPFSKPTSLATSNVKASTASLAFTAGTATVSAPVTNHEYQLDYTPKYNIGDLGPGGGVIFITPSTVGNSGGYYYECAPRSWYSATSASNYDPTLPWGLSSGQTTNYNSGLNIGTGYSNQDNNLNKGISGTAFYAVENLVLGGYSDWFIPSLYEWTEMWKCRGTIGDFAQDTTYLSAYMTSSEANPGLTAGVSQATQYYYINFPTTNTTISSSYTDYFRSNDFYTTKNVSMLVRPVRRFIPTQTKTNWTEIGTGVSSLNLAGLSRNNSVIVNARTKNQYGSSFNSETTTITTSNVPGMITTFSGVSTANPNVAPPTHGAVTLSWNAPSDIGGSALTYYLIERTSNRFLTRGSLITGDIVDSNSYAIRYWVSDDSNELTTVDSSQWRLEQASNELYTVAAGSTSTVWYIYGTLSWQKFRIRALNGYGHGPWSGWISVQNGGYVAPPYFPPAFK